MKKIFNKWNIADISFTGEAGDKIRILWEPLGLRYINDKPAQIGVL